MKNIVETHERVKDFDWNFSYNGKPKRYAGEWLEWLILRFQCQVDLPTSFLAPRKTNRLHPILRNDESNH